MMSFFVWALCCHLMSGRNRSRKAGRKYLYERTTLQQPIVHPLKSDKFLAALNKRGLEFRVVWVVFEREALQAGNTTWSLECMNEKRDLDYPKGRAVPIQITPLNPIALGFRFGRNILSAKSVQAAVAFDAIWGIPCLRCRP